MQVSRKKIDENNVRLTVSLEAAEVDEQIEGACMQVAYQSQVMPEEGKPIYELLMEKLDPATVNGMLNTIIMDHFAPFAIADRKIRTVGAPTYQAEGDVAPGKPFDYRMMVVPIPEFSLDSYEPVEITVEIQQVGDEQVEQEMQNRISQFKTTVTDESHDTVESGDQVELKMRTTLGDEEVKGLSMDARVYQTASQTMPDQFDEAIIGMKVGETKTFTFEGPSMELDEDGNLLTDTYESTATVLRIVRDADPEVDDEWVDKNIFGAKTVDQFRDLVRAELTRALQANQRHYENYLSASKLAERFNSRIPDAVFEAANREQQLNFQNMLAQQGITKEQFLAQQGMDEQQFNMMNMMQIREQLRQQFSIDALIRHENLKLADEDIDEFFKAVAPGQEMQTRNQFEKSGRMSIVRDAALRLKANDWLTAHAVKTYRDPAAAAVQDGASTDIPTAN